VRGQPPIEERASTGGAHCEARVAAPNLVGAAALRWAERAKWLGEMEGEATVCSGADERVQRKISWSGSGGGTL
jgi:hypothetical protein